MTHDFHISQNDWSLHRKGEDDQLRHQQKMQQAIKQKLPELISSENIILSNGKNKIRIPIRSLEEHRFRYANEKQKQQGNPSGSGKPTSGVGQQAGEDFEEMEVQIEDLDPLLFAELSLPHIQPKQAHHLHIDDIHFNDIRKSGIFSNIDKKKTLLESIRRHARTQSPTFHINKDDLRFKTWQEIHKPESNAVIFAMMDTSGSMGQMEKYCARTFFFWMARFLRTIYKEVKIVFIAHHTEAKVVDEEHFFSRGESGGTICSSVYTLANQLIDSSYPPEAYNIYPIHFSDGDNLMSDNSKCIVEVNRLLQRCNMFGYAEVNPYNRTSTLMHTFRQIQHPRFTHTLIKDRSQVYLALKHIFSKK